MSGPSSPANPSSAWRARSTAPGVEANSRHNVRVPAALGSTFGAPTSDVPQTGQSSAIHEWLAALYRLRRQPGHSRYGIGPLPSPSPSEKLRLGDGYWWWSGSSPG